jgi:hypothetical protein
MVKPREFRTSVFLIDGAVTFTLGPWSSLLGRIPDKNDRCAFTRGSRGEVMIFFCILSMYKHVQGQTPFLPLLASSRVRFLNYF